MLLLYPGNDPQIAQKAKSALSDYPIQLIGDESLDMTMQQIAEHPALPVLPATQHALLYAIGMDRNEITRLLEILEEKDVPVMERAVKTDQNWKWTLKELKAEVRQEAEIFEKRKTLENLLGQIDPIKVSPSLKKTALLALQLLNNPPQNPQDDREMLEMATQMITGMLQKQNR